MNESIDSPVQIRVNGKPQVASRGATIAALLASAGLAPLQVVVELNGQPLDRDRYEVTALRPGDRIEIAQMVGGG